MDLAFRSTGANGSPSDEVGHILRGDHVEELGSSWDTEFGEVKEQMTGDAQAVVDLERLVEMRVDDKPFPSYRGTRLLEVNPHHDSEVLFEFVDGRFEKLAVFAGG